MSMPTAAATGGVVDATVGVDTQGAANNAAASVDQHTPETDMGTRHEPPALDPTNGADRLDALTAQVETVGTAVDTLVALVESVSVSQRVDALRERITDKPLPWLYRGSRRRG